MVVNPEIHPTRHRLFRASFVGAQRLYSRPRGAAARGLGQAFRKLHTSPKPQAAAMRLIRDIYGLDLINIHILTSLEAVQN